MGERGFSPSRFLVLTGVVTAALTFPAGAGAHAAFVDAEAGPMESDQCADPVFPCNTIAEAAPWVEDSLAVVVDDSADPYEENVVAVGNTATGADDIVFSAVNFDGVAEGPTVIDGPGGTAVTVPSGYGATISGFHLRGNTSAVTVNGRATISNNTFDDPDQAVNSDVEVLGPGPTSIANNDFTDADLGAPDTAIELADGSGPATLSRNEVSGYATAVDVGNTAGAVTLGSDLLTGNGTGLVTTEDVIVENATLWDNAITDISITGAQLTLDSSILEKQIVTAGGACAITFSRGPLVGSGCDDFTTTADPGFVNPGGGDYHLDGSPVSPMIDAGNPSSPTVFRDVDGNLRELDGDGDGCPAERDIGADEYEGTILDCSPPPDPPPPPPQPQPGDTTPPDTVIESGPSGKTKSTSATFTFSSTEAGSTFECSLDGGSFRSCSSPQALKVKKGAHGLEVRAADTAGNLDPTPASWKWTVKKRKGKKK